MCVGTEATVALIAIAIATGYTKCVWGAEATVALIAMHCQSNRLYEMCGGTETTVALIAIAKATGYMRLQ